MYHRHEKSKRTRPRNVGLRCRCRGGTQFTAGGNIRIMRQLSPCISQWHRNQRRTCVVHNKSCGADERVSHTAGRCDSCHIIVGSIDIYIHTYIVTYMVLRWYYAIRQAYASGRRRVWAMCTLLGILPPRPSFPSMALQCVQ